ncbi:MAG: BrnA antitoxin family protein [Betaproteobacteria bacterium]|nr:BrnA antitoxin family protein [Betaproteobacteria bacterium]
MRRRPDVELDLTDMPEVLNWADAMRGKFYRPIKKPISIRVDADVLAWFKAQDGRYQARMNEALREYMRQRRKGG